MTLSETKKLSKHIFRLLKVNEITFPIGRTANGNLGVNFNVNNEDFDIVLDSIPLSTKNALEDENNIELKNMIEKYLFSPEKVNMEWSAPVSETTTLNISPVKKVGRPKGSKNGNTKTKEVS